MTAPTLAMERTALAWRRTSLAAAACALLFSHEAISGSWPTVVLPVAAASAVLLLTGLGWYRGRTLDRGRIGDGRRPVAATTLVIAAISLLAVMSVLCGR